MYYFGKGSLVVGFMFNIVDRPTLPRSASLERASRSSAREETSWSAPPRQVSRTDALRLHRNQVGPFLHLKEKDIKEVLMVFRLRHQPFTITH